VVDSRSVALTQTGRQQLRDIRQRLRDLMRVPPSDDAFQARVAALAAQVQQVLADNVGPRRSGRSVAPDREVRSEVD
jgi:Spy/CpxP family protein refolding chaperone